MASFLTGVPTRPRHLAVAAQAATINEGYAGPKQRLESGPQVLEVPVVPPWIVGTCHVDDDVIVACRDGVTARDRPEHRKVHGPVFSRNLDDGRTVCPEVDHRRHVGGQGVFIIIR